MADLCRVLAPKEDNPTSFTQIGSKKSQFSDHINVPLLLRVRQKGRSDPLVDGFSNSPAVVATMADRETQSFLPPILLRAQLIF